MTVKSSGFLPQDIVIRSATLADLPALILIENASFTIPWSEQSLRIDLENSPPAYLWVAQICPIDRSEPEIVGYIACYLGGDHVQINNIAVLPHFRGSGIGRKLLEALLSWASQIDVADIDLEVRPSNAPAIALYSDVGFNIVGRRPHYYADNDEDANIMLKKLT
ncbi:MAG: ribosomal protein S18-alanine N-acetyltransferase [Eubacteriales bacterium]|nr:ribosomal protein S18-alanine N-acetyltransferase [Eubacteriales bacterium]